MFRQHPVRAFCLLLGIACLCGHGMSRHQTACASSFGYSLNINFGAQGQPVDGAAGVFDDLIWNNFGEPSRDDSARVVLDQFGNLTQSDIRLTFESSGVGVADRVKSENPNDIDLMRGYLQSPSKIVLEGLDQLVPLPPEEITYSLVLYTFGGRAGDTGHYRVNGREQDHVDSAEFMGDFHPGMTGNVLVFKDLVGPLVTIETDGFGPMNAISLIYCRPGDFNGDGVLDVSDLNELNEAVKSGAGGFSFDVNFDLTVDFNDVLSWIKCSKGTCIGDVNLDGVFDSNDLIDLFAASLYETGDIATWTTGDFNGDCKFDSSDLIAALQEGQYETGEALATTAWSSVPEPAGLWLIGSAAFILVARRRRRDVI